MTVIICAIACILPSGGLPAQTVRDTVFTQSGETSELRAGLDAWKARLGRIPDAHLPRFDDRDWQIVRTPHRWEGEGTDCWFRRMFVVPGGMNGKAMALELAMDGWGELFVNGQSREKFRNRCVHEITAFARAGEVFHLAVHGKSETVFGMLMDATLTAEDAVDADLAKRASRIDALRASMVAGVCDGWLYHEGDGVPQASVPGEGRGWRGASLPHLWQRDNVAV